MSQKTIAEIYRLVIFLAGVAILSASCAFVSSHDGPSTPVSPYGEPVVVSRIKADEITESSGIAASRCDQNVLWTHNDSGNDPVIFAVSTHGQLIGRWKVKDATNNDWEDIAAYKDSAGKCYLYIGDTGDNKLQRAEHSVYRIPEPLANAASGAETQHAERLKYVYPDTLHDAETLMVEPKSGDIYVVTKEVSGAAGVYRIKPQFNVDQPQKAELVASITVPAIPNGYLTGGDISPDGRRMILCDYTQGYEYTLPDGAPFDQIWKVEPVIVNLGKRSGGEAVGYSVDGTSVFATSEGKNPPLIEVKRR